MMQVIILFLQESSVCLLYDMELFENVQGVLQWNRTMESFHYVHDPSLGPSDPVGKVHVVWHSCTKHNNSDVLG